ncbi:DUF3040 domain-containing protein [Streptomyces sp. CB03234]|uniref:DUF3040 domain-containing protein n=1 Tax=Streptomyces sp. (strain CB03234) TaxID=1703937 RepID=UPI001301902C|nr:DUF3040 domain-containing protein [Streptomyces sp. CB03234]
MDDRHILAEMERHLARDDPELASVMDALNRQFPENDVGDRSDDKSPHDWQWKVAIVFAVVAVLGMILTAVFTRQAPPDDNKGPPNGVTPARSVQIQRRVLPGPPVRHRRTSTAGAEHPARSRRRRDGVPTLVPDASRRPFEGPSVSDAMSAVLVRAPAYPAHPVPTALINEPHAGRPERAPP